VFSFSAWCACLKLRVMLSENILSGRLLFVTDVAFGLWAFPGHFRSRCNIWQSVGAGVDGFAGLLQDLRRHFCMRRVWHSHKRACMALTQASVLHTTLQSSPAVVSPADKPSAADKLSSVARVTQVVMVVAEVHSKVRMVGKYCGFLLWHIGAGRVSELRMWVG
jgi:hypothetical protein